MKKGIIYLCIVSLLLSLCACGDSAKGGGTLTICADGNGLNEMFLGPILAEFESQNPQIELDVQYLPPTNSKDSTMAEERTSALTRTRTELMSGKGADVYLFFNYVSSDDYETYMLFPNLEQQIRGNVFHDLDFLFEHPDFDETAYISAVTQAGVYEGKSYVLPISYTVPSLIALAEPLENSSFDENTASTGTKAYMEQLLALSEKQRPYLSIASRQLLLHTPSLSPVSVEEAKIRLDTAVWQEALKLNRHIVETCGYSPDSQDDFFTALEYEQSIQDGAVFLPVPSVANRTPGYYLRMLEDEGHTTRLLPIPNENGGLTMMPIITAVVSAGCKNTDAAANLLLFLLSDTVQGSKMLEQSGSNAALFSTGTSWPVRKGCALKMVENIQLYPVKPGIVSEVLKTDLEKMENRIDSCRLAGKYDAQLYGFVEAYLYGTQTWEECYSNIEKEWSYLDE